MDPTITKAFLEHGLLGVLSLGAVLFAWRMYKDRVKVQDQMTTLQLTHQGQLTALQTTHQERLDKLHAEHHAEMKALEERYVTKSETWMGQYHDLAQSAIELAQAQERRYGR